MSKLSPTDEMLSDMASVIQELVDVPKDTESLLTCTFKYLGGFVISLMLLMLTEINSEKEKLE